jgi:hypothetical protein
MMEKSNVKPITYALIALIIFSLLGLEFPMLFLSRLVDGRPASQAFNWPMNWYGAVFHWTVTILIWAAGAVGVYLWTKKKGVLPDLIRLEFKSRDGIWLVIGILFGDRLRVDLQLVSRVVHPPDRARVPRLSKFVRHPGLDSGDFSKPVLPGGIPAGGDDDRLFSEGWRIVVQISWFPWGGIGIALTWGMIHLVTNPQGALGVILWAVLLLGIFFILSKKSFVATWIIGVLGFIL